MGPVKPAAGHLPCPGKTLCRTPASTRAFGVRLARLLRPGQVVALSGELGAGKTTLVQGIAKGLGVADLKQVTSPSYTLVNEYPAEQGMLIHIDLYRLESPAAIAALGLDDYLGRADAFVVIEWAERMRAQLEADTLWIEIAQIPGGRMFCLRRNARGIVFPLDHRIKNH